MSLFSKKKTVPAPEIGYQDVLDYLRDLEQPDYTKILKVVKTYRDADKKVKKILNIKDEAILEPEFADLLIEDDISAKPTKPKKAAKK